MTSEERVIEAIDAIEKGFKELSDIRLDLLLSRKHPIPDEKSERLLRLLCNIPEWWEKEFSWKELVRQFGKKVKQ